MKKSENCPAGSAAARPAPWAIAGTRSALHCPLCIPARQAVGAGQGARPPLSTGLRWEGAGDITLQASCHAPGEKMSNYPATSMSSAVCKAARASLCPSSLSPPCPHELKGPGRPRPSPHHLHVSEPRAELPASRTWKVEYEANDPTTLLSTPDTLSSGAEMEPKSQS